VKAQTVALPFEKIEHGGSSWPRCHSLGTGFAFELSGAADARMNCRRRTDRRADESHPRCEPIAPHPGARPP